MMHLHSAKFTTPVGGNVVYETCGCGAVRRLVDGRGGWHACGLCVGRKDGA